MALIRNYLFGLVSAGRTYYLDGDTWKYKTVYSMDFTTDVQLVFSAVSVSQNYVGHNATIPVARIPRNTTEYDDTETPLNSAFFEPYFNAGNLDIIYIEAENVASQTLGSTTVTNGKNYTLPFDSEYCYILYCGGIISNESAYTSFPSVVYNTTGCAGYNLIKTSQNEDFFQPRRGASVCWEIEWHFVANDGYKFDETSIASFRMTPDNPTYHSAWNVTKSTISDDGKTLVITMYPWWREPAQFAMWYNKDSYTTYNGNTLNVYLDAVESPAGGNPVVIGEQANCTIDGIPDGGFLTSGTRLTLTATANTGFAFTTTPYLTRLTESGLSTHNFTVSSDKKTATISGLFGNGTIDGSNITIYATAEFQMHSVTVETATNCTVEAPSLYFDGDTFIANATPSTGFIFETAPVINYTDTAGAQQVSFTIDSDGVARFTGVIPAAVGTGITISATAVEAPAAHTVIANLEHCTSSDIPSVYYTGDTISATITAEDGYYFDIAPTVNWIGAGGQHAHFTFTLDEDRKIATLTPHTLTNITDTSNVTISAQAIPSTTYEDKYGSINIYNVTVDNLNQFAESRFIQPTAEGEEEIDLGQYVSKLFRVYCNIGATLDGTMNLGNYNLSNINVLIPIEDTQIVDCGSLTVTGFNNSANDFNGTLKIMLPFIGFQNIDIDTSLNHVLHVYYKVNIVTGESVCFLEVDNVVTYVWDCNTSQEIIFMGYVQETFGDYEFKSKFLYGFTPFILHTYTMDSDNYPVNNSAIREMVKNCLGYFEMNETTPFTAPNMNEYERERIIELLNTGVFYGAEFPHND